eukprot:Gb_22429 [translate_table: standard]
MHWHEIRPIRHCHYTWCLCRCRSSTTRQAGYVQEGHYVEYIKLFCRISGIVEDPFLCALVILLAGRFQLFYQWNSCSNTICAPVEFNHRLYSLLNSRADDLNGMSMLNKSSVLAGMNVFYGSKRRWSILMDDAQIDLPGLLLRWLVYEVNKPFSDDRYKFFSQSW